MFEFVLPVLTLFAGVYIGSFLGQNDTVDTTPQITKLQIWNHSHHHDTLTKWELKNISHALHSRFPEDFPQIHEVRLLLTKSKSSKRKAEVVCRYPDRGTFKTVVDVRQSLVVHQGPFLAVQPMLQDDEVNSAKKALRQNPLFVKMIEEKGLKVSDVEGDQDTVGYWGDRFNSSRRLVSFEMYDTRDTSNWYARPLNLRFVVDIDTQEIVTHFSEDSKIPSSRGSTLNPPMGDRKGPKHPVEMSQPKGVNFKINGSMVIWEMWRFRLRLNQRLGPILSMLEILDNVDNIWRSLAREISMSEMFVPYMDVSDLWYFKTYFDIGEYGVGNLAQPLDHLSCGENAHYLSFYVLNQDGNVQYLPNVTCIFERATLDPVWHHGPPSDSIPSQTRKDLELVVRTIPMVGNYDYIIDFVFSLSGNMKIRVGATGSDAFRAGSPPGDPPMGAEAQSDLVAPFHDHFVNFRLDLDVDGTNNSLIVQKIRAVNVNGDSKRTSRWAVENTPIRFESEARLKPHRETAFKIANANGRGYEFIATGTINQLMAEDDFPAKRASFTRYPLWVTKFDENERFAAGEFPNQGPCLDGLESFSNKNRSLINEDLVLWFSVGFHHLTRHEDFPVLNTKWTEFSLKPYNFFKGNIAINLTTDY